MKATFSILFLALTIAACNSNSDQSAEPKQSNDKPSSIEQASTSPVSPVNILLEDYLKIKNALANDDDKGAATAGKNMFTSLNEFDPSGFNVEDRKFYNDIADDAKEHAEHIGDNSGKIEHQREHFDMLSKDMYDLAKKFGAGEKLYVTFCPMYNDNKGATWLSETKEISNPYFGNKMKTCGEVKEELQ